MEGKYDEGVIFIFSKIIWFRPGNILQGNKNKEDKYS